MNSRNMSSIVAIGLGIALFSQSSAAQDAATSADSGPDYLAGLKACQGIENDDARLQCYDNAVGRVVTASDQGEVRLVDREDVDKTRRSLFGFTLPDLGIFGDGNDSDMELLESKVTRIVSVNRDKVTFEIEEGSVWYISDAPARVLRRLQPGSAVVFKKAAMGTFFIRVDGMTGVKGRRIE